MAKKGGNNNQNLKPITSLSKGEAKERGSKGGKASAKARLDKKMARDAAMFLLSLPVTGDNIPKLTVLGIPENAQTNFMLGLCGTFKKWVGGDAASGRLYLDITGLMPDKELSINGNMNFNGGNLAETLAELREDNNGV